MRILVRRSTAIMTGFHNALIDMKYESLLWDGSNALDTINLYKPDLLFISGDKLDRSVYKGIIKHKIKPIIFLSEYDKTTEKERDIVFKLVEKGVGKLFFTNNYHTAEHVGWTNSNCNVIPINPAADIVRHKPGKFIKELNYDILFFGIYTEDRKKLLKEYLVPLCDKYRVVILGNNKWPTQHHLGTIDESSLINAIASSKVVINLPSNPHQQSERVYKTLACGGKCLTLNTGVYTELCENNNLDEFNTYEHLLTLLNSDRRFYSLKSLYENDTYFNRLASIFSLLNLPSKCEDKVEELKNAEAWNHS